MKLTVFGATGGTGSAVVRQALAAGHEVTAAARRPEAVTEPRQERLSLARVDVLDPASLGAAVEGRDAVISALGIGMRRHATTVYSAGTGAVADAMRAAGVKRLLVVSTTGLQESRDLPFAQRLVVKGLLQRILRAPYADMAAMEELVRGCELEWTVVRAGRLTDGAAVGGYRVAVDRPLRGAWTLSRADLARCLLDRVEDADAYRRTLEVAY